MGVDDPRAVALVHLPGSRVAGDAAVLIGSQRDYPAGVTARRHRAGLAVHDRHRPLAVDVDLFAGRVEVPGPDPGRTAADLGELQPLRAEEPLHVRRRRSYPEGGVNTPAHLA